MICAYENCIEPATTLAYGRTEHPNPTGYCDEHAAIVTDEDSPEYTVTCRNCHCRFGVN
jgi:hypothetical protein